MAPRGTTRVWRAVLVKGGNEIRVQVKVIREHVLYVVCEPRFHLPIGKKQFHILKGAVLVRNTKRDVGDQRYFMVFNNGHYEALRSQDKHVPQGNKRERATLDGFKESVDSAKKLAWYFTRLTTEATLEEYEGHMKPVKNGLAHVNDDDKVVARERAQKASRSRDSLGRINGGAKNAGLWSLVRFLDARIATTRRIDPRIGFRASDLLSLTDEVWKVKSKYHDEVEQALRWWKDGRVIDPERAEAMAKRFEKSAGTMRSISVAPFSRRGFPRIAADLTDVVDALRAGRYDEAKVGLDKCRRAFKMMDARKALEEICTTASCVRKAKATPSSDEIQSLILDLDAIVDMLFENDKPLDFDFKNPVIEKKVIPYLNAVRAGATGPDGYQAKVVHIESKNAAEPL